MGTRREVEGLIRTGRVSIDGHPAAHPSEVVAPEQLVTVDGDAVRADPRGGAVVHRAPHTPLVIAHPPTLHAVLPLRAEQGGLELLLADETLARRLGDPAHPLAERWRDDRRIRLGAVELGDLAPGAWRPLSPRERERLRLGARLPPNAR